MRFAGNLTNLRKVICWVMVATTALLLTATALVVALVLNLATAQATELYSRGGGWADPIDATIQVLSIICVIAVFGAICFAMYYKRRRIVLKQAAQQKLLTLHTEISNIVDFWAEYSSMADLQDLVWRCFEYASDSDCSWLRDQMNEVISAYTEVFSERSDITIPAGTGTTAEDFSPVIAKYQYLLECAEKAEDIRNSIRNRVDEIKEQVADIPSRIARVEEGLVTAYERAESVEYEPSERSRMYSRINALKDEIHQLRKRNIFDMTAVNRLNFIDDELQAVDAELDELLAQECPLV